jgi:predicted dithiol-disulfide oxidoreductase (DUF899 family)
MATTVNHPIVSREEWNSARGALLQKEKELTHRREAISAELRALPWVKITKEYLFQTAGGKKSLLDLFDGHSQLFVYHFMLAGGWQQGCPLCSAWADGFNGLSIHLPHRDASFKVISSAPLDQILKYRERLGWQFDWVSADGSDFNYDIGSSLKPGASFPDSGCEERSCISCFYKEGNDIYQTYFTTGRVSSYPLR